MAEEDRLRLENALLRSEVETFSCFIATLRRSLFPSAASTWTWQYAVMVMTALSLEEVVSLTRFGCQMWTDETLNLSDYYSNFFPWYARNAPGFLHEASRASALVPFDASSLVTSLMDLERWPEIFPSIIVAVSKELEHQDFQMINMDMMPITSPLIQPRNVKLLRCCKRIQNNTWVIADVSVYFSSYVQHIRPVFLRFPSGYLVQHVTTGVSRVTVLDHWVYHKDEVTNQYRPYRVNPYSGFGAHRWLAALKRHCYDACICWIPSNTHFIQMFDPIRKANLLHLAGLMVYTFCTGVCGITAQRWMPLRTVGFPVNDIRMFTRESRDVSGVPCVLVSATGLVRIQAKPESVYGLMNRADKKDIWNYLEPVGGMKEMIRLKRSLDSGNEVTVFSIEESNGSTKWCLIEEKHFEVSAAMIVHACVEASSLAAVINGGDLSTIEILPCGFTIMPCGQGSFVSTGCHVIADHAILKNSPAEVVNRLENMVTNTLMNVQNAFPLSLTLH